MSSSNERLSSRSRFVAPVIDGVQWNVVAPSRDSEVFIPKPLRVAQVGISSGGECPAFVAPLDNTLLDVDGDASAVPPVVLIPCRSPTMSIVTFFDGFDRRPKPALVALAAAHGIDTVRTDNLERIRKKNY
jgi:hypothetical protein